MRKPRAAQRPRAPAARARLRGIDQYGFLAGAIAGRKVTVQWSTKGGESAYSDGLTIFLPFADGGSVVEMWAAIAAQAALIGAGSLNASILAQLVGRPALTRRYLYLEILRAVHVLADRLPWAFTEKQELRVRPLSDSTQGSLKVAASRKALPEPPAYFGSILPLLCIRTAVSDGGLAALSRTRRPGRLQTARVPGLEEGEVGESSKLLRLFQGPLPGGNPLSGVLDSILGRGVSKHREAAAGDAGGAELPVGLIERAFKRGIHAARARLSPQVRDLERAAAVPAFVYPEWDVHANAYRRGWVFVQETAAWRADGPRALGQLQGAAPVELRRQLSGLGVDQETHRRQSDGSDLDLGALMECAIEIRSGHSPPALQVYRASRRTRRDLAITLVIDLSGSTGEIPPGGDSIFQKQLKIAHDLGQVFDSLGDQVAMFGFHSWGRQRVRVVGIKGHAERWSLRVAQRMALLEPLGYTRLGAAIRHGTRLLHDTMRLPNRLLVLVTDGIAYDVDYELTYAAADSSRALAEAREAGTACVCLTVGSGTDYDKLREVFGAANLLAVDEVAQVTGRIRDVCRHALASVSRRRFAMIA